MWIAIVIGVVIGLLGGFAVAMGIAAGQLAYFANQAHEAREALQRAMSERADAPIRLPFRTDDREHAAFVASAVNVANYERQVGY